MALVFNDRVKETSTTTGTGTLTLDGAVTGFETFSSAIGNTNTTYYAIELPNTAEFEVGLGTVSAGQLARTQVFSSSNSDALVNFSAGTKNVFCTLPASKFVPGKLEGTDFTNSLLIGHATTGTLSGAENNTGVGIGALDAITSGDRNVALGTSALTSLTSGLGNVAVGHTALTSIANGLSNTGVGEYALNNTVGNRNTGVGSGSLFSVGNSSWNTGLGVDSGRSINTGNYNIAIGYDSGDNITSGDGNVIIGTVDADSATGDRQLKIAGHDGTTTTTWISGDSSGNLTFPADLTVDTDTLYVDSSNNRVGIGTSSPGTALHMRIDGGDANLLLERSTAGVTSKWGIKPYNNKLHFRDESASPIVDNFTMTSNGYFGIGTASPSTLLHLSSSDPQITITDTDGTGSQVIKAVTDNLEIVSSNHIKFDADSGLFAFKDSGTDVFSITNTGNIIFKTVVSDSDLLIRGNDGGSEITALTFDMSEAGAATFNSTVTANSGVIVDNITIDGNEIDLSSGDLTLDVAGDIILNADGGDWIFRDGGTELLKIFNSSSNVSIKSQVQDKDLQFLGNDGGVGITALTLDMSEAGAATFNDKVILGANKVIEFGDAGENISGDGTSMTISSSSNINLDAAGGITLDAGTSGIKLDDDGTTIGLLYFLSGNLNIKPSQSDTDLVIKGNDGGSEITALTLDMSEAGAATFNSSVTVGANLDVSSGTIKLDGNYPTGTDNVALGDTALDAGSLSGGGNTAIGSKSLSANTTGENNTAVGEASLFVNTTGVNNVAIGNGALQNNTYRRNTAVGYSAGSSVTSGENLTLLGYNAEPSSATATNEITLGDANVTSLRIPGLTSGASSGDVLTYDGTDIGFSTPTTGIAAVVDDTTPQLGGDLDTNGNNINFGDNEKAQFGDSNDLQIFHNANNSVILDNGTGSLSLQSNGTYVGLYDAANTNHMVLANVGADVQLYHNGSQKLATTASGIDVTGTAVTDGLTVAGNVSVDGGTIKLDGNYPTGTNNVAMGDTAFDSVTSGADNTVIGSGAGTAVTTGQQNTVVGSTALNTGNATGNTAIGFRALRAITGANNVGIGRSAGHDASGGQNTFVGGGAGYYINGTNNVAVGYQAGNGFGTTGSSNIFMGFRAGDNITNGSNNIIIGTSADASSATASNEITLGDANITSLRIPGLQSGASSGDVLTYDGTNITLSTPSTGASAGFAVAMAIAL